MTVGKVAAHPRICQLPSTRGQLIEHCASDFVVRLTAVIPPLNDSGLEIADTKWVGPTVSGANVNVSCCGSRVFVEGCGMRSTGGV